LATSASLSYYASRKKKEWKKKREKRANFSIFKKLDYKYDNDVDGQQRGATEVIGSILLLWLKNR
jgi:hypothetical protein